MQTPALMQQIATLAEAWGLDPAQLSVGHRANKVNPRTGQREFAIGGWRKTDWRGGLDEAREPQIEEMVVSSRFGSGGYSDPFHNYGYGGLNGALLSEASLGVTDQQQAALPLKEPEKVPVDSNDAQQIVAALYQRLMEGIITKENFLYAINQRIHGNFYSVDDVKAAFRIQ